MKRDDALAAVLVKEGWGPLPGLPRLIGTVTQASSSRVGSAQCCESQVPIEAERGKRRRRTEPDEGLAQKCHRRVEAVQVAAAGGAVQEPVFMPGLAAGVPGVAAGVPGVAAGVPGVASGVPGVAKEVQAAARWGARNRRCDG